MGRKQYTLEIENPGAECGECRFGHYVSGTWSVEDGRLVFRADADPLRTRGPDFEGCSESSAAVEFTRIVVNDSPLSDEQVAQLRATAKAAQEAEMRSWYEASDPTQ